MRFFPMAAAILAISSGSATAQTIYRETYGSWTVELFRNTETGRRSCFWRVNNDHAQLAIITLADRSANLSFYDTRLRFPASWRGQQVRLQFQDGSVWSMDIQQVFSVSNAGIDNAIMVPLMNVDGSVRRQVLQRMLDYTRMTVVLPDGRDYGVSLIGSSRSFSAFTRCENALTATADDAPRAGPAVEPARPVDPAPPPRPRAPLQPADETPPPRFSRGQFTNAPKD